MSLLNSASAPRQVLLFGGFLLMGAGVGSAVAILVGTAFGIPLTGLSEVLKNPLPEHAEALKWMNNASQLFTFLLPAILFMYLSGDRGNRMFTSRFSWPLALTGILWIWVSGGVIDAAAALNEALIPDNSLLASWFKPSEEHGNRLAGLMLADKSTAGIVTAALTIGLFPAFCEEVAFRGVLQPLLAKSTGRYHLAIWLTAAVFSAIHFQFYGFLPRMLLGVLLGYLVWWSGSIWPAVLAHLFNNLVAIMLFHQNGGSLESPDVGPGPRWVVWVISAALSWLTWRLIERIRSRNLA